MIKCGIIVLQLLSLPSSDSLVNDTTRVEDINLRDSVVSYAKEFLGTTYVWGGCTPTGFDCSGFVYYVFQKFQIPVIRTSSGLASMGNEIAIDAAKKGDVILFRGTHPGDKSVGHLGIVISNPGEPLMFIHSSSSKMHYGVVITDYYQSGYPKRFIGIRRLLPE